VDEFLNAVLFVLLGLEILVLTFTIRYMAAGLLLIPVTIVARWASVGGRRARRPNRR
jgi:CPA1 family monovalent cation:H+ antiporter